MNATITSNGADAFMGTVKPLQTGKNGRSDDGDDKELLRIQISVSMSSLVARQRQGVPSVEKVQTASLSQQDQ